MTRLIDAIRLAQLAHAGQYDKVGQPFIGHPLRVMARGRTETEMIVRVLHDVPEDTPVKVKDLWYKSWLTDDEVAAIDALTRRESETYRQYIERLSENALARGAKRADILHNADPARQWDGVPTSRYRWAWEFLFPDEPLPASLQKN